MPDMNAGPGESRITDAKKKGGRMPPVFKPRPALSRLFCECALPGSAFFRSGRSCSPAGVPQLVMGLVPSSVSRTSAAMRPLGPRP